MNLEQERPFVCSAPGCSQVSGVSGDINWVLSTSSGLYNASWYINTCLIIICVSGFFCVFFFKTCFPSILSFPTRHYYKIFQTNTAASQKWVGKSAPRAASVPFLIPKPDVSSHILQILLGTNKRGHTRQDTFICLLLRCMMEYIMLLLEVVITLLGFFFVLNTYIQWYLISWALFIYVFICF